MKDLIREIREKKGMSQQEFAQVIGVTQSMVAMLEAGERRPGRRTLAGLLKIASPEQEDQLLMRLKAKDDKEPTTRSQDND